MNRLVHMTLVSVAIIVTFIAGSDGWAAEKAAKLIPARIAVVSRSTLDLPFWVAREQGFFREEGIYVELGKERERFAERAYEAATQGYLLSGVVDEKLPREMIAVAAQRVKSLPQIAPERIFEFNFARRAGEALR